MRSAVRGGAGGLVPMIAADASGARPKTGSSKSQRLRKGFTVGTLAGAERKVNGTGVAEFDASQKRRYNAAGHGAIPKQQASRPTIWWGMIQFRRHERARKTGWRVEAGLARRDGERA